MPEFDFERYFLESNRARRAAYLEELIATGAFSKSDLGSMIPAFRKRAVGETLLDYRELQYKYYWGILEYRWNNYLSVIERELIKSFEYGGLATVAQRAAAGYFEIPEKIIQYDMYNVQANTAMRDLLGLALPTDLQSQQIAAYLESTAWRTAARSAEELSENSLWAVNDSVKRKVNSLMAQHVGGPSLSRADFVKLLKEPLEGTSPITGEARARMIARTEATRAEARATEALADAMRSQGYQIVEIWRIAQNTNVCPDCEALDGLTRNNGWTDYPPLHPNCDCRIEVDTIRPTLQ